MNYLLLGHYFSKFFRFLAQKQAFEDKNRLIPVLYPIEKQGRVAEWIKDYSKPGWQTQGGFLKV